ncbi:MAG: hypothetical protein PWP25_1908 [Sphaerochaeta sp.]|jgi:hypothetical protein|uniref:Lipoprotein n=1 Tax=Sphaerochaeta halotolerans TaxID=2293840 RepID=A0A372ME99_9SPIR|nr:hypothetical protein [Sphaerochaeta halotolerans]MBG0767722.1 hypothetical protein [Spirochaetaceae bacterium]MDK2860722.1 hypothetical protein [Sphaerochaeta sp.]MDN5334133.1 hypothetical protein [Sphaerochaeta sp.]RFU94084.1 hypothetical protein DYP60_11695 [Sphaerochaeta halotolerans]
MKEKQEETKADRTRTIVLSGFALVVLFIFAFGCYGCSYQPITPPDPEEAIDVTSRLVGSSWTLDDAQGPQEGLEELHNMVLSSIEFSERQTTPDQELSLSLQFADVPPLSGSLIYQEEEGFSLSIEDTPYPVIVVYSQSKDGKTETLTLKGQESNIHCYYLKK